MHEHNAPLSLTRQEDVLTPLELLLGNMPAAFGRLFEFNVRVQVTVLLQARSEHTCSGCGTKTLTPVESSTVLHLSGRHERDDVTFADLLQGAHRLDKRCGVCSPLADKQHTTRDVLDVPDSCRCVPRAGAGICSSTSRATGRRCSRAAWSRCCCAAA